MKKASIINKIATFFYGLIILLPFVSARINQEKKSIIAEYTSDNKVREMCKNVLTKDTHILNVKSVDVKKGRIKYSLILFETKEGKRKVGLQRHIDTVASNPPLFYQLS